MPVSPAARPQRRLPLRVAAASLFLTVVAAIAPGLAVASSSLHTSASGASAAADDAVSAGRAALTWRDRYARRFVAEVRAADWPWVRKQGSSSLVRTAKGMYDRRNVRVLGQCGVEGNGGAYCYLSNGFALTFNKRANGTIRVAGLYAAD